MIMKNVPLLVTSTIAGIAVLIFSSFSRKWGGRPVMGDEVTEVPGMLAPLVVAATFIERAVEILISPCRNTGANKLQKAVDFIQARPADPTTTVQNAIDLKAASDELDEYRGKTQQYAFAVSLTLSMLTSIAGVRALRPFIDPTQFKDLGASVPLQASYCLCRNMALSAALLAGGADGIHSIMSAITTFFSSSVDRMKQLPTK